MTRPAQYLLMALAFDVYWTLVVMLRERGLLIWLTLALFALAAAAGGQPSARSCCWPRRAAAWTPAGRWRG